MAILGGGAWGTTLSILCAENGHHVSLWVREQEVALQIENVRENPVFLPGIKIPSAVQPTGEIDVALHGAEYVVLAIPARYFRDVLNQAAPLLSKVKAICSVTKGIEETGEIPSQILGEVLGEPWVAKIAVLSGPNLSMEIAKGLPAATVVASKNPDTSTAFQNLLHQERFRVYTSEDVVGVEWGGVLKNIIAIAAGVVGGLRLGDNAKSALLTRGLTEMARFGVAMGGKLETFYGLSGLGDLLCTSAGELSRNYRVGVAVAGGKKLDVVLSETPAVAEGVFSARTVLKLAREKKIDMPITEQVVAVLFEHKNPRQALQDLMLRGAKSE